MLKNMIKSTAENVKAKVGKLTADGWANVLTGLNISGKDKQRGATLSWRRTDRDQVESLFSSDDIAGKIAKQIPFDATRAGITWSVPNDVSNEKTADILKQLGSEFERLKVWESFNWAYTLARAYGGALIFVSVDDGQELSEPLIHSRIRKINGLHVIDRWDLTVSSADIVSKMASPNFGKPEFYTYNVASSGTVDDGASIIRIHNSRVIRFDGERLPMRLYVNNNYWHDSIYQRMFDAIRNYSTGHGALATILQETNQPVFKIDGLHEAISEDDDELVLKRMQIINQLRSSMRAVVLDKEDDFQFMQTGLAGVADLMQLTTNRLVACTDIPHTRLLGESPGGSLGEGGKSELIDYYDTVSAMQETDLRTPVEAIKGLIFGQEEMVETEPEDLSFVFNPLYQQNQKEIIESRKMQAEIDEIYMNNNVMDSVEVAQSRFGGDGDYSFETSIDIDEDEPTEEEELEYRTRRAREEVEPVVPEES